MDKNNSNKKMIEIPCEIGDTVYRIKKIGKLYDVAERTVTSMTFRKDHSGKIVWELFTTATDVLGKTVFLTKREAEEMIVKTTRNRKNAKNEVEMIIRNLRRRGASKYDIEAEIEFRKRNITSSDEKCFAYNNKELQIALDCWDEY